MVCGLKAPGTETTSVFDQVAVVWATSLQEYTAQLASRSNAGNEYEAAAAQVGVEVYSAMLAAIGG
jgi:hypothetical protein